MGSRQHNWGVTIGTALVLSIGIWSGLARLQADQRETRAANAEAGRTISVLDLQPLHKAGEVLLIDVRDESAFDAGHIAGAMNVPVPTLVARVEDVRAKAASRPIVTYCSCPAEGSSLYAVGVLADHGLKARALVGGYRAWTAAGGR
jgi:rhodanese-related sulfurtransferase